MIKNNKGISIIALVVTIIVILILATVSITYLTGENGIIKKANEAKTNQERAAAYEQVLLSWNNIMAQEGMVNKNLEYKCSAFENDLQTYDLNAELGDPKYKYDNNTGKATVYIEKFKGYEFEIIVDDTANATSGGGTQGGIGGSGQQGNTNTYTVIFYTNEGNDSKPFKTYEIAENTSIPSNYINNDKPTRDNYSFKGWFLDRQGKDQYINQLIVKDTPLYAKWEKINTYTVTFSTIIGSIIDPVTVEESKTVNKPNEPTKDGFEFAGWYIDANYSEEFDFTTPITQNITLYAKWKSPADDFEWSKEGNNAICLGFSENGNNKHNSGFFYELKIPDKCMIDNKIINVKSISNNAFENKTNIRTLLIPDSVTSIGDKSFSGCSNIETLTLSQQLESIGKSAFEGCYSIASLVIPDSVTSIGDKSFSGCSNIETLTLSQQLESIGKSAFYGCYSIESLVIPNSVIKIDTLTFASCTGITSLTLPVDLNTVLGKTQNTDKLGEVAPFLGDSNIEKIHFTFRENQEMNDFVSGAQAYQCANYKYTPWYISKGKLDTITFDDNITKIGAYSFNYNGKATITLPKSISTIGEYAFFEYNNYDSEKAKIILPEPESYTTGFTSVGTRAFYNCKYLTGKLSLNSSIEVLGSEAFYNCKNLIGGVDLSNEKMVTIGDSAFAYCSGLSQIKFSDKLTTINKSAFRDCSNVKTISFVNNSNNVGYVGDNAFLGCTSLEKFDVSGLQSIGTKAFAKCTSLDNTIKLTGKLNSIGSNAFEECTTISEVIIDDDFNPGNKQTSELANYVFRYCTGITNITIPVSLKYLSYSPWDGCTGVASVTLTKGNDEGNAYTNSYKKTPWYISQKDVSIIIKYGVKNIYDQMFYHDKDKDKTEGQVISIAFEKNDNSMDSLEKIGSEAFRNCKGLTSISLPSTLTSIGSKAFYNCYNLESEITIPDGVTVLPDGTATTNNDEGVFGNCSKIVTVKIPDTLEKIGTYAFSECTALQNIFITQKYEKNKDNNDKNFNDLENLKNIGDYAFNNCSKLTGDLIIPESVINLGASAFSGCSGIDGTIKIKASITTLNDYVFYNCSSAQHVYIYSNLEAINKYAFSGCSSVTDYSYFESTNDSENANYKLPNSLQTIGASAFNKNSELKGIIIPNGIRTLGDAAFANDSKISNLTIPITIGAGNATSTTSATFYKCKGIRKVHFTRGITYKYGSINMEQDIGYDYSGVGQRNKPWYYSFEDSDEQNVTVNITFDDEIKHIGKYMFENCVRMKPKHTVEFEVVLPNQLKTIGDYAFASNYDGLDTIKYSSYNEDGTKTIKYGFPDSVTKIGEASFNNCSLGPKQVSIEFPSSVITIGKNAFNGNTRIENVSIGDGTISIGDSAFDGCSNMKDLKIGNSVTTIGASAFYECSELTSITIPSGVTTIGDSAFRGCSKMTDLKIGNSVTTIGASAFNGCSGLTSITIPSGVTTIGDSAFDGCSKMENLKIGNSVTTIGASAFYKCNNLKNIYLPKTLETIGANAFKADIQEGSIDMPVNPANVYYEGTKEEWNLFIANLVADEQNKLFYYASIRYKDSENT